MYSERFNLNITQLPFENAASQKPLKSFHFKFIILFSFLLPRIAHAISFDWFRSGLEWILYFEFCLLKLLIFYHKLLWNIRSMLNSSKFWVFEPVFTYVWSKSSFLRKKLQFWSKISKYRLKNSKCGRVKPRSDIP